MERRGNLNENMQCMQRRKGAVNRCANHTTAPSVIATQQTTEQTIDRINGMDVTYTRY